MGNSNTNEECCRTYKGPCCNTVANFPVSPLTITLDRGFNISAGTLSNQASVSIIIGDLTLSAPIPASPSQFTSTWVNSQYPRLCVENSYSSTQGYVCLESACGNYLVDWQLSFPGKSLTMWNESIRLRPVFCECKDLDGTISENSFQKRILLGSGGFSKVYLVRKKDDGKVYAMKVISKRLASYWKGLLVKREFDLWREATGQCPFVVNLCYSFCTAKSFNFVMELCPGGTLLQLLNEKGKLDVRSALIYFIELMIVLEYLHTKNIVFRDLKVARV